MDGSRPPALDHASTNSKESGAHRCGWCGLLPLAEDQPFVDDKQLCGVCFGILEDIDWPSLLRQPTCVKAG
jgi:hypothetical protein